MVPGETVQKAPVALVTGASSGIGLALLRALVQNGFTTHATYRRAEGKTIIEQAGGHAWYLDVLDEKAGQLLMQQLEEHHGQLDLLIHNAGWGQMGPLLTLSETQLRAQHELHVLAPHRLTRQALPLLRKSRDPVVVVMGSISAVAPSPFAGAYCAAKAAVHAYSDVLRMELRPLGIEVVRIEPGAIASSFGATAMAGLDPASLASDDYRPFAAGIRKRAGFSQRRATPAEALAARVVAALHQHPRPAIVRYGQGSRLLPLLRLLLPYRIYDRLLALVFGLTKTMESQ